MSKWSPNHHVNKPWRHGKPMMNFWLQVRGTGEAEEFGGEPSSISTSESQFKACRLFQNSSGGWGECKPTHMGTLLGVPRQEGSIQCLEVQNYCSPSSPPCFLLSSHQETRSGQCNGLPLHFLGLQVDDVWFQIKSIKDPREAVLRKEERLFQERKRNSQSKNRNLCKLQCTVWAITCQVLCRILVLAAVKGQLLEGAQRTSSSSFLKDQSTNTCFHISKTSCLQDCLDPEHRWPVYDGDGLSGAFVALEDFGSCSQS